MVIHRRATVETSGEIPDKLMDLCKAHAKEAAVWKCLPRSGRHGYKHAGLELEVVIDEDKKGKPGPPHTPMEVAAPLMTMMQDHQDSQEDPPDGYRIDAFDLDGVRLNGEGDFLRFQEREAIDIESSKDKGTWAMKALADSHKRYCEAMDRSGASHQIAQDALDALVAVIGDVVQIKLDHAEQTQEDKAADRKHEKQSKVLDWLLKQADGAGASAPLEHLLEKELPDDVKAKLKDILGADEYAALVTASKQSDRAVRAEMVVAIVKRMQAKQARLNAEIPAEWQSRLREVLFAEVKAGQPG